MQWSLLVNQYSQDVHVKLRQRKSVELLNRDTTNISQGIGSCAGNTFQIDITDYGVVKYA